MPTPLPVEYPLAAPTVTGDMVLTDLFAQPPEYITQDIIDLTARRLTLVTELYDAPRTAQGGAVIYQVLDTNRTYTTRDVEYVEPGEEFPLITAERGQPVVAAVAKYGGKDYITDESRDRNDLTAYTNMVRQMANTMVRKSHQRGVDAVEAAITAYTRTGVGNNWGAVVVGGSTQTVQSGFPHADFADALLVSEVEELGFEYDGVGLNPQEMAQLRIIYGTDLAGIFSSFGLTPSISNRWPAGTATFYARRMVGGIRVEKPLGTENWREPNTERTWFQTSARNVFFVDKPLAIYRLTGLAG